MMHERKPRQVTDFGDEVELSPQRRQFIEHFISSGFNASEAYVRVFKTKNRNTAKVNASRLLTNANVQEYLSVRLKAILKEERIDISQARVLKELERLAFTGITDVIRWDKNGRVSLIESCSLSEDVLMGIKKFKMSTTELNGDTVKINFEIDMQDKKGALDTLVRFYGMFADKKEVCGPKGGPITLAQAIADIEDANTSPGGA